MYRLWRIAKNKYVIVTVIMITWITFFDRYNLMKRFDDEMELRHVKQDCEYYREQVKEIKKRHDELLTNQETMERFARERYFMKKAEEEVFIVEEEHPKTAAEVAEENKR